MVCCCISCKAGQCSQGLLLPGPCRAGGGCDTSLAVTSPRCCHLPWSFPRHSQTCWGGQWWLSSPGPMRSLQLCAHTAAVPASVGQWPPVRATLSCRQGTQLREHPRTKPGPPHASPSLWASIPEGLWLTQLGKGIRTGPFGSESSCSTISPQALALSGTGPSPWSLLPGQWQI